MPNYSKLAGLAAATVALSLATASSAVGQNKKDAPTWVDITTWNYEQLYDGGWSAQDLLFEEVYGENGEVVGEVEDLILGPDGKIRKVVVEGGGFLDIGDSHIAVPWDQITRVRTSAITAPITEESLEGFGLFEDVDNKPADSPNWRLRDLLGDYLTLGDGIGFGIVDDVIFDQNDKIEAVIVRPSYGYGFVRGPVAFPYLGDAYRPHDPFYATPYTVVELKDIRPFNYGKLK